MRPDTGIPYASVISKHESTGPDGSFITQLANSVLSLVSCTMPLLLPPQPDQNLQKWSE